MALSLYVCDFDATLLAGFSLLASRPTPLTAPPLPRSSAFLPSFSFALQALLAVFDMLVMSSSGPRQGPSLTALSFFSITSICCKIGRHFALLCLASASFSITLAEFFIRASEQCILACFKTKRKKFVDEEKFEESLTLQYGS